MDNKKIILSINPKRDFSIIGIVTSANDYFLCWTLNKLFKVNFVQSKEIKVDQSGPENHLSFSTFSHIDNYNNCLVKLISNKGNNGYLLKKIKKYDFFLYIDSNFASDFMDDFIKEYRSIPLIRAIYNIPINQLSDKEKQLILNSI